MSQQSPSPEIQAAYEACAQRLVNHRGIVLETARRMGDVEARHALFATYHSLLVAAPARLPRPMGRARSLEQSRLLLREWRDQARMCSQGEPDSGSPTQVALTHAMERFRIPMNPWLQVEEGLVELGEGRPIPDLAGFLVRARGLSHAPSKVLFRILCSRIGVRRYHVHPEVDVEELAHDPAVFAYTVGVMCDVFSELEHFSLERTSLPEELLRLHSLDLPQLAAMRHLHHAPRAFEMLMRDLALLAWNFYEGGVSKLTQAAAYLPADAITQLDFLLGYYKRVLKTLERTRFAPAAFRELSGGLQPRFAIPPAVPSGEWATR